MCEFKWSTGSIPPEAKVPNLLYHNHLQITINEPHLTRVMIDQLDVTRGSVLGRQLCDIMMRFLTTSGDRVQLACRSRRRRIFIGYSGSISA